MKPRSDLIYDIGMFDGKDTEYYLFRGYYVLAVDANPQAIEEAKVRFAKQVQAGRLTLLNVGISETPGTATFWVCDQPECSSFDRTIASREGIANRPVSVNVIPFSQLLHEHGVPNYLKIDIEGNDRFCVEALKGSTLPTYISVESECVGDSTLLSDEQAVAMLELLRDVGYRRFKLVNQIDWIPVQANVFAHYYRRLVPGNPKEFTFSPGATGPWGEDIPSAWVTFEKARSTYLRARRQWFSKARPLYSFWHDWHATY
jgi:FkbM family methyltransferase